MDDYNKSSLVEITNLIYNQHNNYSLGCSNNECCPWYSIMDINTTLYTHTSKTTILQNVDVTNNLDNLSSTTVIITATICFIFIVITLLYYYKKKKNNSGDKNQGSLELKDSDPEFDSITTKQNVEMKNLLYDNSTNSDDIDEGEEYEFCYINKTLPVAPNSIDTDSSL